MEKKQLYIIDGHALIYRAYYALIRNPLTTASGQPTSAVFGFAGYLLRLLQAYGCPYWTIVLDSPQPTFRHELYADYKANREAMPDDLSSQIPLINRLIKALNIPSVIKPGLEADDLVASLADRAAKEGFEVFIITKDKDLMQLIGPSIKMLAPGNPGELMLIGPDEVRAKMGVGPELVVDYLALTGDASDNVPGVQGVGPKTALKILEAAGSVERLLENPGLIESAKLREKVEQSREKLLLSRKLVTLDRNACDAIPIESLKRAPVNREECLELFKELELHSFLKHPLFAEEAGKLKFTTEVIRTAAALQTVIDEISRRGLVALDTETTSLEPRSAKLVGISLAADAERAWYLPLGHKEGDNLPLDKAIELLKPVLESTEIRKIGQNLKYDCQVFRNYGITLRGIEFDCMIAAYLIDPGKRQYNLERLAEEWLHAAVIPIEELIGKGKDQKCFSETSIEDAARYAGEDAVLPIMLKLVIEPLLAERGLDKLFREIEMPLVEVLAELEWNGVLIDTEFLARLADGYEARIAEITAEVHRLAGTEFNLNSPKQVSDVLFHTLNLPHSKKTKVGSFETNVDVLERLARDYPIARRILDHREASKLLSTYIAALPAEVNPNTGRVHTSFNQTVAATGRLSSTAPNLQNIPIRTEAGRQIREAFIAPPGFVIASADYSQIELRILAHLSGDVQLVEAFLEDRDIHRQTAAAIYSIMPEFVTDDMRRAAKTINFGLMYGMGPVNLGRQLGISFSQAQSFIDTYFAQFPNVKNYLDSSVEKARRLGYTETLLGRRRQLPELNADNHMVRQGAERIAINTPVQGTAADIIKIAMRDIHASMAEISTRAKMLLQVHDELVFEVPEDEAERFTPWVADKMSNAIKLSVPLKVDIGIGRNWSEAH